MGRDGRARDPQDVTFVTVAKLVQDLHAAAGVPFASAELLQVFSESRPRCDSAIETRAGVVHTIPFGCALPPAP